MNRMRFALFYNRTDRKPEATAVPVHVVAGGIEVEAIGAAGIALVGRRAPIVAALSNVDRRRPVTPTGGGKEDGFAVSLTRYFIAVMATLCRPCPGTLGFQLFKFRFCGHSPRAAPSIAGYIVGGVTADVTHTLAVCLAIICVVTRLGGSFAPGVIIAVIGGGISADIAGRPLYAETQVYPLVAIV